MALILSRKIGEKIIIDGIITITLLDWQRGEAKISIDAPRSMTIIRPDAKNKIKGDAPPHHD
jgi:carbon storage regulator CsrA